MIINILRDNILFISYRHDDTSILFSEVVHQLIIHYESRYEFHFSSFTSTHTL